MERQRILKKKKGIKTYEKTGKKLERNKRKGRTTAPPTKRESCPRARYRKKSGKSNEQMTQTTKLPIYNLRGTSSELQVTREQLRRKNECWEKN